MSNTLTNGENMSERKLKPAVNSSGGIIFIKPSSLGELGVNGVLLEGIFTGSLVNNFDETKSDYKFETSSINDSVSDSNEVTAIINNTGSLAYQMKDVVPGTFCQVIYNGKTELTRGKMAGKLAHDFVVNVEDLSESLESGLDA